MAVIQKAPETMTARERVRKTFNFEKTDRVTIGYEANAAIHARLKEALGVTENEDLLQALGVDYRRISARYVGPKLFEDIPDRRRDSQEGFVMRWAAHKDGGYWDFCDYPLKDAEDEDFENYPIPDPDNYDYEGVDALVRKYQNMPNPPALHVGDPGMPDIINANGRIMGMEDILCHLMLEDEAALAFVNRRIKWQLGVIERILARQKDNIDFVWLGEDLGTQIAPMVSLELFRKLILPAHKQFVDLASSYNLPVIIHTCGSSSWAYEDFISIGVRGVDTLQPEAANMSPAYLAEHFGGRLNFRGCISTAGPLAYGTAEETVEQCKYTLETLMKFGGYHFAPTHAIQDNSPTENVIAMYNAAHKYGRY